MVAYRALGSKPQREVGDCKETQASAFTERKVAKGKSLQFPHNASRPLASSQKSLITPGWDARRREGPSFSQHTGRLVTGKYCPGKKVHVWKLVRKDFMKSDCCNRGKERDNCIRKMFKA